jgi:hypothetical protein
MAGTVNGASGAATLATPGDAESGGIDPVEQPAINTTIVAKLRRSVLFCIVIVSRSVIKN